MMAVEVISEASAVLDLARKRRAKRRRAIARRFADQFTNAPVVITPRWQQAIDNYKRAKGIEPDDAGDTGNSDA